MTARALFILLAFLLAPLPAAAGEITYLRDPVFEKMAEGDSHPMDEMIALAEGGDLRAQFILGDLYSKGKGGLPRNITQARHWFETSAAGGYGASFIRLAALEKRAKKPVDAYKWYTLGIDRLGGAQRKWCAKARDALTRDAKLTRDQIKTAKQKAAAWEDGWNEKRKHGGEAAPAKRAPDKKPAAKKTDRKTERAENRKPVLTAAEALTAAGPGRAGAAQKPDATKPDAAKNAQPAKKEYTYNE